MAEHGYGGTRETQAVAERSGFPALDVTDLRTRHLPRISNVNVQLANRCILRFFNI